MSKTNEVAVVLGATGSIGAAVSDALEAAGQYAVVLRFSRSSQPSFDLTDEASIANCADAAKAAGTVGLVFDATGFLHDETISPEKALRQLTQEAMEKNFRLNAMGPALVMKHFLPLFPREGRAVFATLSARVGSISDNSLGGWHSYRASKAALNQFVRCAAIELKRTHQDAVCVALHPGTVQSDLSAPFAKAGLNVRPPGEAAADLLRVIDGLTPAQTGCQFAYDGA
ncbi:MAG: SDR family NAD(P)-dependent oxidoreductase, partial [Pseudomonadota bacterium]